MLLTRKLTYFLSLSIQLAEILHSASHSATTCEYIGCICLLLYTTPMDIGVAQGRCLVRLMLIIYMNDLARCSIEIYFLLYADDTTLYVSAVDIGQCISIDYCESMFIPCVSLLTYK